MIKITCPKCGFKGINISTKKRLNATPNFIYKQGPHYYCSEHGAMNKVSKSGMWRCLTCGVGYSKEKETDSVRSKLVKYFWKILSILTDHKLPDEK